MPRRLSVTVDRFPLAREFRIARGAKTEAVVLTATLVDGEATGRGECVPYTRYDETVDSVRDQIEAVRGAIEAGADRDRLADLLPAGAARNALDCALWDIEAKHGGTSVAERIGHARPQALETAFTIGIDEPEAMAAQARAADRPLLKIKVGTSDDTARLRAVHAARPDARFIIDANEGWSADNLAHHMTTAAACGAALIEQPLPAGQDGVLAERPHPVPVCADESVHTSADLKALAARYDFVNIKLDKTGGLTEALALEARARELGFGVMVGCMVGSSLAMAPAVLLAQRAEFVDLDGPLLLAQDRPGGLSYEGSSVAPPDPAFWG